jgi:tetratricopeptide (TPR) repeat protein
MTATARHQSMQAGNPRWLCARSLSRAILFSAILLLSSGCSLYSKARGPVPQDVADCRKLSQRAVGALHRGDVATAESLAQRAVQTNPQDAQAHQFYSEALWRAGQRDEAIVQALEAQKLQPDDPLVTVRLGEQYQEQGRSQEAAELATQAIDLCPSCGGGWALRARARASLGQLNESLPDFQQALRFQPADQKLLLELAELHRRMNRPERALATLGSLRETYPAGEEPPQLLVLEADAFAALQRWPQAVRARTQLAQRMPSPENWHFLSIAQQRAGQEQAAQLSLAEAQRLVALGPPTQYLADSNPAVPGTLPNLPAIPPQIAHEPGNLQR